MRYRLKPYTQTHKADNKQHKCWICEWSRCFTQVQQRRAATGAHSSRGPHSGPAESRQTAASQSACLQAEQQVSSGHLSLPVACGSQRMWRKRGLAPPPPLPLPPPLPVPLLAVESAPATSQCDMGPCTPPCDLCIECGSDQWRQVARGAVALAASRGYRSGHPHGWVARRMAG